MTNSADWYKTKINIGYKLSAPNSFLESDTEQKNKDIRGGTCTAGNWISGSRGHSQKTERLNGIISPPCGMKRTECVVGTHWGFTWRVSLKVKHSLSTNLKNDLMCNLVKLGHSISKVSLNILCFWCFWLVGHFKFCWLKKVMKWRTCNENFLKVLLGATI